MRIILVTSAAADAGTDSPVLLTVEGDKGKSPEMHLQKLSRGNPFGRGGLFSEDLPVPFVGKVMRLLIRHKSISNKADWFLNYALVEETPGAAYTYFPCYRNMSRADGDAVELKPATPVKRPFYAIDHMCNTPEYVNEAVRDGANAMECDLKVYPGENGGLKIYAYHGGLFGIAAYQKRSEAKTDFDVMIKHIGTLASKFAMVMFDLKPPPDGTDLKAYGQLLAQKILPHLSPEQVVFSITLKTMKPIYDAAVEAGMKGCGLDISTFDMSPVGQAPDYWSKEAEKFNVTWLSLGRDQRSASFYSEWVVPVRTSVQLRKPGKKVYFWTLDGIEPMRHMLAEQVDGIITNDPRDLLAALKEPAFNLFYRLATKEDKVTGVIA